MLAKLPIDIPDHCVNTSYLATRSRRRIVTKMFDLGRMKGGGHGMAHGAIEAD